MVYSSILRSFYGRKGVAGLTHIYGIYAHVGRSTQ